MRARKDPGLLQSQPARADDVCEDPVAIRPGLGIATSCWDTECADDERPESRQSRCREPICRASDQFPNLISCRPSGTATLGPLSSPSSFTGVPSARPCSVTAVGAFVASLIVPASPGANPARSRSTDS